MACAERIGGHRLFWCIFGARFTFPRFFKGLVFGVFCVCVILWCGLMNFDVDAAKVLGARRYGDITSFGM